MAISNSFAGWLICLVAAEVQSETLALTLYEKLTADPFAAQQITVDKCLTEDAPRDLQELLSRATEKGGKRCAKLLAKYYCEKMQRLTQPALANFPRTCNEQPGAHRTYGLPNATRYVPAEETMGLAFVLLASQNMDVAKRLLKVLQHPENSVAVHIDTRFPSSRQELEWFVQAEELQGVEIFSELSVHRGGPSMLKAQLAGIQRLLRKSSKWQYYLFLSDSDYPVAPVAELGRYLRLHWPMNFAGVVYAFEKNARKPRLAIGRADLGLRARPARRLVLECGGYAYTLQPELDYPDARNRVPGTGSFSVILERGFLEWLLANLNDSASLPRRIYDEEVSLGQPDETFFQAVLLNTEWCNRHIHYSLHYSWIDSRAFPTYALDDSDITALSPAVLSLDSAQEVRLRQMLSADSLTVPNATLGIDLHRSFFARKFRYPDSIPLLEEIDAAFASRDSSRNWRKATAAQAKHACEIVSTWLLRQGKSNQGKSLHGMEWRENVEGVFSVRFRLSSSNRKDALGTTKDSIIEAHERLALPLVVPSHPGALFGRILSIRILAGSTSLVGSLIPASSPSGLMVEAQLSSVPVPAHCSFEVRWIDPRSHVRASQTVALQSWQTFLSATYPQRRGPARIGEWEIEISEHEACQSAVLGGLVLKRSFFVYSQSKKVGEETESHASCVPVRIPSPVLSQYFDFNLV